MTPTCTCGHDEAAHEHYRPGSDCGFCGPRLCPQSQPIHPREDPRMADHAAPPDSTIEVKVVVSSLVTLAASLVVAWLNGIQDNPSLLGALDPTWQFVILTGLPPLLTFAGGWVKTSNRT